MNGYVVIESGRNITSSKDYYKGVVPNTTVYSTYAEAIERRKALLSYRSANSIVMGITAVILKVKNGKII